VRFHRGRGGDLREVVDEIFSKRSQGMSSGQSLYLIVLNRAIEPKSKAALGEWLKTTAISEYLEVDYSKLDSAKFWDHMEKVGEQEIEDNSDAVAKRVTERFDLLLIRKKLKEQKMDMSLDWAMEALCGIRIALCYYPRKSRPVKNICRLGSSESKLLNALNIQILAVRQDILFLPILLYTIYLCHFEKSIVKRWVNLNINGLH